MILVSSAVRATCASLKPGVITRTISGAATKTIAASTTRPASMRFVTVETTRQARCVLVRRQETRDDRDERRRQGAGGNELEDEVR